MTEAHKDTSGNYEDALKGLVDPENHEMDVHAPATTAVHHGWLHSLLAGTAHLGTWVATSRGDNPTKIFESIPIYVRLGMQLLYRGKEQAKLLGNSHVEALLQQQSIKQGKLFDQTGPGVLEHIQGFVKTYEIDCSELLHPNIADYKTFNSFFYRQLRPDARPPAEPENAAVISSAADCRLVVFETGQKFTIASLLDDEKLASKFEGGSIAIFRLAPADYHRYHSPLDATIGPTKNIEGTYYTVNPVAVNEDLNVFTKNRRDVTVLSVPAVGVDVGWVAVGAMLVGSINHTKEEGSSVKRGEDMGYFAYGGSTCIALFPPGKVQWDADLAKNSEGQLETLVKVGERIGTFV
ncbi:phosphatidylserine decarboxylase [Pseudohyphozyma bogoriensis]|nr:phosphatidylserine decarboxylase [Pseudohyphozyma bogoriensis]